MYDYRKMTPQEKQEVLQLRKARGFPLHAPPHFRDVAGTYLITSACYEHRPIFENPQDLSWLTNEILAACTGAELVHPAWVILPNHYHILVETKDLTAVSETLRLLHSRVATEINSRQRQRGRRVWYRFSDRLMRSERHYFASINYVHYNPIKHGYVDHMEAWPWSSLPMYVEERGKEWLSDTWKTFPVKDYGKGWDW